MSWQDQRVMMPDQFAVTIHRLGMSQAACARYLGLSARQVSRLLRSRKPVPVAYALLFNGMLERGEKPEVPKWSRWNY